ncbi:MAG: hypothetical protein JWL63_897 [Rhodocyclales bacterium]|nr:hypothetical protein [Rhodocyclales bacterium]
MKYQKLRAQDFIESLAPLSQRPERAHHWPKSQTATDTPLSHQLIGSAHENALILQAMPSRYRGGISVFAMGLLALSLFGFLKELPLGLAGYSLVVEQSGYGFLFVMLCVINFFSFLLSAACVIAALRFLRLDLFSPKEIPLVFNRATRKVYRFSPDMPSFAIYGGGWSGVWLTLRQIPPYVLSTFTPFSMLLVEYDWDCLEAEYREETVLSNNVMRTVRHLDLLVREAPGSDTLIGSFPLAPSLMVGEPMARAVWEHVRRFMDHNGPALSPGDQPAPPPPATPGKRPMRCLMGRGGCLLPHWQSGSHPLPIGRSC